MKNQLINACTHKDSEGSVLVHHLHMRKSARTHCTKNKKARHTFLAVIANSNFKEIS